MKNILVIGKYTFKDLIKSRIMFNVVWVAFFLQLATYITSEFSYGNPKRVALDFGLGISSLASAAISIFLGVKLIASEIETRTIYIALSRPIQRYEFFLGKLLGMTGLLFLNVSFITALCVSMYFKFGGVWNGDILISMFFTFAESFMLLLMVVFFSLVSNTVISVMNSMILFILGYALPASLELSFVQGRPLLEKMIKFYSIFLPNFDAINMKAFAVFERTITQDMVFKSTLYVTTYSIALILISIAIFNKKELE